MTHVQQEPHRVQFEGSYFPQVIAIYLTAARAVCTQDNGIPTSSITAMSDGDRSVASLLEMEV